MGIRKQQQKKGSTLSGLHVHQLLLVIELNNSQVGYLFFSHTPSNCLGCLGYSLRWSGQFSKPLI